VPPPHSFLFKDSLFAYIRIFIILASSRRASSRRDLSSYSDVRLPPRVRMRRAAHRVAWRVALAPPIIMQAVRFAQVLHVGVRCVISGSVWICGFFMSHSRGGGAAGSGD